MSQSRHCYWRNLVSHKWRGVTYHRKATLLLIWTQSPQVVINNWLIVDHAGHYNFRTLISDQSIYIACWMKGGSHMQTTKSMRVFSYKIQGHRFILRKSVWPWRKVHSAILRSGKPCLRCRIPEPWVKGTDGQEDGTWRYKRYDNSKVPWMSPEKSPLLFCSSVSEKHVSSRSTCYHIWVCEKLWAMILQLIMWVLWGLIMTV